MSIYADVKVPMTFGGPYDPKVRMNFGDKNKCFWPKLGMIIVTKKQKHFDSLLSLFLPTTHR